MTIESGDKSLVMTVIKQCHRLASALLIVLCISHDLTSLVNLSTLRGVKEATGVCVCVCVRVRVCVCVCACVYILVR